VAEVGDRVAVTSKAVARAGVVTAVTGSLLRVRWDTGEETSFAPAAGALRVIATAKPSKGGKKKGGRPTSSAKKTVKKKR
jgi:hypothetical protein